VSIRRYLATFYRGKWLYLPILALLLGATALGAYYLAHAQYEASARIWVEKPVLDNVLTPNAPPGYVAPPAQQQADKLGQLIQTDSFVAGIMKNSAATSQLTGNPDQDRRAIADVRSRLGVTALGSNTVRISYRDRDPALCQQIVKSTIDAFLAWNLTATVEQNTIERQFYEKQLQIYQNQMNDAAKQVDDFQQQHPYPDPASPQYLQLQSLQRALDSARALYAETQAKIEQANAAQSLDDSSRQAQFQVLDAPALPAHPSATLGKIVKYLGFGIAASLALVIAAIAIATWQDTTVRTPEDLRQLSDAPVLDAMPHLRPIRRERRRGSARPAMRRGTSLPAAEPATASD